MGKRKGEFGSEIPEMNLKKQAPRRASYEVRAGHMALGAVLMVINWAVVVAGKAYQLLGDAASDVVNRTTKWGGMDGSTQKSRIHKYRSMERKGFRVTSDELGCMVPDERYCTTAQGQTEKGYQLAFFARHGWVPKQFAKGEAIPRSAEGRDLSPQLSHLCHKRYCCRLDHVACEPKWRNFMRNWCTGPMTITLNGGTQIDTCGCSAQLHLAGKGNMAGPKCLRAYSPSPDSPPADAELYCKSFIQAKQKLVDTGFPFAFSAAAYADRDAKGKAHAEKKQKGLRSAVKSMHMPNATDVKKYMKSPEKPKIRVAPSGGDVDQVVNSQGDIVIVSDNDDDFM